MTLARDGGDEISDKQAARAAIAIIEGSGTFIDACRDWWKKPEDEQTLANFKTHFKTADTQSQRQAHPPRQAFKAATSPSMFSLHRTRPIALRMVSRVARRVTTSVRATV
jgi:hypothetical protein